MRSGPFLIVLSQFIAWTNSSHTEQLNGVNFGLMAGRRFWWKWPCSDQLIPPECVGSHHTVGMPIQCEIPFIQDIWPYREHAYWGSRVAPFWPIGYAISACFQPNRRCFGEFLFLISATVSISFSTIFYPYFIVFSIADAGSIKSLHIKKWILFRAWFSVMCHDPIL